jgi:catechol 2,3-dioxygenase-like lactoylglutathione lyase family enzyme
MTDNANTTRISQVATVFVPVTDEARCAFATTDIEADHATLRATGVDVDEEIARAGTPRSGLVSIDVSVGDPVPPQFFLRDPDGNRFLVVEPG